jgi:hypothetical protein
VIGFLLFAWLVLISIIQLAGMQETFVLQKTLIQHDVGCAYTIPINHRSVSWPVTTFTVDSESTPQGSRLILLEESQPIGQSHALHEQIRTDGNGNYSHWGNTLYFSLPNCVDPRDNVNIYAVSMYASLTLWAKLSYFIAAALFALWIKQRFSDHPISLRVFYFSEKALDLLISPINLLQRPYRAALFLVLLLVGMAGYFAWLWESGRSVSIALSGAYQISDAMGYWSCANLLLDNNGFDGIRSWTAEWCQRRIIYPALLAGLAWIAQENIHALLILQAAIVCIGIFVLMRRSSPYISVAATVLGATLLFRYSTTDLFGLVMTENAGLIFGCIGIAILIKSIENKSLIWVAAGVAIFSIALNARAGAFFVLPFLVLWSGLVAHSFNRNKYVLIALSSVAATSGFILQAVLLIAVGGDTTNSHGSFSYVLYGLSVGGMGWQQVLVDHPELANLHSDALIAKAISSLAWDNIESNPQLFINGLIKNLSLFTSTGTYGFEKLGALSGLAKLCWWLAWIPLMINARKPFYLLISLSSLGVILSTPFLLGDGGARVYAATVAVDVLQIGVGLNWILSTLKYASTEGLCSIFSPKYLEPSTERKTLLSIEMGLILFLIICMTIPFVIIKASTLQKYQLDPVCKSDEYRVITYFGGRQSMLLSIVEKNQTRDVMHGDTLRDAFIQGLPNSVWYGDDAVKFKGRTLLTAYQLDKADEWYPGPYFVISDKNITKEKYNKLVLICLNKDYTTIFGNSYRVLNSITVLE